jgi:hypothetical protein
MSHRLTAKGYANSDGRQERKLSGTEVTRLAGNQPPPPTVPPRKSTSLAGNTLLISWPSNYAGCRLESNSVSVKLSPPRLSTEKEIEYFVAGWQSQVASDLSFEKTTKRQSTEAKTGCQQAKVLRQVPRFDQEEPKPSSAVFGFHTAVVADEHE